MWEVWEVWGDEEMGSSDGWLSKTASHRYSLLSFSALVIFNNYIFHN
ncbi:MAG: hypothetical protein F6K65_04510 [Moorea sp. SIO3C2]|nr:hypothetical protein [Moorena sp. SIO3C2]